MLFALIFIFFSILIIFFVTTKPFGKNPTSHHLTEIRKSKNYKKNQFANLSKTTTLAEGATFHGVISDMLFHRAKDRQPPKALPSLKNDLLNLDPNEDILVWFGHSSYFIQLDGKKFLIDPVFSGSISPLKITNKSYGGSNVYLPNDFPEIDYLIITHDHWDHLDYETVIDLKNKVSQIICPIGVASHLKHWGYEKSLISELDWYSCKILDNGFEITALPARHFSGRRLTRNRTLWASYYLKTPSMKLYLGGDSGYDTHFKNIGENYGPFDLAILECGQYNKSWKHIHMMPEETYQAGVDLIASRIMPVHWSKFTLSLHSWDESIKRVSAAAENGDTPLVTPMIGEKVDLKNSNQKFNKWWETV